MIKKIRLFCLALLCIVSHTLWAQQSKSAAKPAIEWKTFAEVEALMKTKPKKVLIDVYTNWCGWCKKMDAHIYENADVIKYINANFYAVKFNAEQKEDIVFRGKTYKAVKSGRGMTNELAIEMMGGRLSYPTTIFMEEKFENPVVQPGYLNLNQMESILKYIGTSSNKKQSYEDFVAKSQFTWK